MEVCDRRFICMVIAETNMLRLVCLEENFEKINSIQCVANYKHILWNSFLLTLSNIYILGRNNKCM